MSSWLRIAPAPLVLLLAACSVTRAPVEGALCDAAHPCPEGLTCLALRCVKPSADTPQTTPTCADSDTVGIGPPTEAAPWRSPLAVLSAPSGETLWLADTGGNVLRELSLGDGGTRILAGTQRCGNPASGDLCRPAGLALDDEGGLLIADQGHHLLRRFKDGMLSTLAGTGAPGSGANELSAPVDVAFALGRAFVADRRNCRVKVVPLDGGTQSALDVGQPCVPDAAGNRPGEVRAVAISPDAGTLYISTGTPDIRTLDLRDLDFLPAFTLLAGGSGPGFADQPADRARFDGPSDLLATDDGVFVADSANQRVRFVARDGTVTTLAGDGIPALRDGPFPQARLTHPTGLTRAGNALFAVDALHHSLRKLDLDAAVVTTLQGPTTQPSTACSTQASIGWPVGVEVHPLTGVVYFTDALSHSVRAVTLEHEVLRVAGGEPGYVDDALDAARFLEPRGLRWRPNPDFPGGRGRLVVAEAGSGVLREVNLDTGLVKTLAGVPRLRDPNGLACTPTDGAASNAVLCRPSALALAPNGDLYFSDLGARSIRRLEMASATISTVLGPLTKEAAEVRATGLAFGRDGLLYAAEPDQQRVRKLSTDGTTVGFVPGAGDCGGTDLTGLTPGCGPVDVAFAPSQDTLYVLYREGAVLRRRKGDAPFETVAGLPFREDFRTGTAALSLFDQPLALAPFATNGIWVADARNHRLRRLTLPP